MNSFESLVSQLVATIYLLNRGTTSYTLSIEQLLLRTIFRVSWPLDFYLFFYMIFFSSIYQKNDIIMKLHIGLFMFFKDFKNCLIQRSTLMFLALNIFKSNEFK